jgi:hypothetical protein
MGDEYSSEEKEKLRSLHMQRPGARKAIKKTTDHHDNGEVDTIEHASGDRVDIKVRPDTFRFGGPK